MSPNRAVVFLTPLVFAPLAGAVAAWLAQHAPGLPISSGDLQEIFIAGALIAFAKSAQWTRGWQLFEQREAAAADEADLRDEALLAREELAPGIAAGAAIGAAAGVVLAEERLEDDFDDDLPLLEQFDGAGLFPDDDDDDARFDEDPLLAGIIGSPR